MNGRDPVQYSIDVNLHRRHLTTSQRAMVAAKLYDYYQHKAKERMRAGGGDKRSKEAKEPGPENLPDPIEDRGDARDHAAAALNVSGRTVDHASKVVKDGSTRLKEAVTKGDIKVSTAAQLADLPKATQNRIRRAAVPGLRCLSPSPRADREGEGCENGPDDDGGRFRDHRDCQGLPLHEILVVWTPPQRRGVIVPTSRASN